MTFLNPLVLLGLAAAAIPILLHLLNLRKLKTVDFSTLRFLKELQKTSIRKLKTQQIILLILRTLIVICCVLAFSRPTIKSSLPAIGSHAKTSVIVILDNSQSMDISDGSGNRFKKAKQLSQQIVSALKEGDELAFIPLSSLATNRKRTFSQNFMYLQEEIAKSSISSATGSLNDALRIANGLLDASININKEVYIISDMQQSQIASIIADTVKVFDDKTGIYCVPIGHGDAATNLSIDTTIITTSIVELEKPTEVQARISNSSTKNVKGVIVSMVFNGERVAQRSIDINAGESATVTLSAPPKKSGIIRGAIMIEPDALEYDNIRHFAFLIAPPPAVAAIATGASTEFLRIAAEPISGSYASFATEQSGSIHFDDYDILIVAGALSQSEIQRLDAFIQAGGTALVFADAKSDMQQQITMLNTLGLGPIKKQEFNQNSPGMCISVDRMHPVFKGVFKGLEIENGLGDSPKITKALTASGGQHIITMQGGSFFTEVRKGNGKMLYCAVPPSPEWSTFPYTGLMPTLIFRSIRYLSAKEMMTTESIAGEDATIIIPTKSTASSLFRIVDPNLIESRQQGLSVPGGYSLQFGRTLQSGVFGVFSKDGEAITALSVNANSQEGHLLYNSSNEVQGILKKRLKNPSMLSMLEAKNSIADSVAKARIGTELWRFFLILAILFALTEMIISTLAGRKTAEA